jgi:hypothetical protein
VTEALKASGRRIDGPRQRDANSRLTVTRKWSGVTAVATRESGWRSRKRGRFISDGVHDSTAMPRCRLVTLSHCCVARSDMAINETINRAFVFMRRDQVVLHRHAIDDQMCRPR